LPHRITFAQNFVVKNYLSLIKFSHTIFAMPFAIVGFFLAIESGGSFSWQKLVLVVLCMVFARSAAMAFNRYIDRAFDAQNPRTKIREIPAGIISEKSALFFVLLNCGLFIISTFFINSICFYLSPVALAVILGYSYTKRFTALCHLVLGLGLSLAPIGAFLAVKGQFEWLPILLSFTVLFWVSGFDIIYALQDEEFDKGLKLNSIPVKFGKKGALNVARFLHILSFSFLLIFALMGKFSWPFWIGFTIYSSMLVFQHTLVKPHDLSKVNLAFMTTNGIASVVFSVFYLLDYFLF